MESLAELLEEQVKDLYSAENQLIKALPKMAKKATTPALKAGFTAHLEETKGHVARLEEVAKIIEIKPSGKTCKAMKGLIEEGKEVIEEDGEASVLDVALIAAARRVEHYEIAAYSTLIDVATKLGKKNVVAILNKTLKEESACDGKLLSAATKIIATAPNEIEED